MCVERKTYETMNRMTELKMKIVEYQRVRRTPSFLLARLSNFKGIAHSSVGMNEFILKVPVHLITQPADQHVHHVGLRIKVISPNVLHNHILRQYPARVAHEIFQ